VLAKQQLEASKFKEENLMLKQSLKSISKQTEGIMAFWVS